MRHLTLEDALELVVLYAEAGDENFDRAACRWLGRLLGERANLTLAEAQLAAVALRALEDAQAAAATLRSIATRSPVKDGASIPGLARAGSPWDNPR